MKFHFSECYKAFISQHFLNSKQQREYTCISEHNYFMERGVFCSNIHKIPLQL